MQAYARELPCPSVGTQKARQICRDTPGERRDVHTFRLLPHVTYGFVHDTSRAKKSGIHR